MKPNMITVQVQIIRDHRGLGVKTAVAGAPENPLEALLLHAIRDGITKGQQAFATVAVGAGATKPMQSFDGDAADIAQKLLQPESTPAADTAEPGKN